jgi:hypothetical protein
MRLSAHTGELQGSHVANRWVTLDVTCVLYMRLYGVVLLNSLMELRPI